MFKQKWWLLLVVGCALTFSSTVRSQTATGTILGTVQDPAQAVVSGAGVIVRNADTGVERRVSTNDVGGYIVPLLQPGRYEVIAERSGFNRVVRTGIDLHVNESARVDFRMEIGAVETTVTVEADASLLQADTAALGTVVNEHQLRELPLNGRDFFQLITLVPGAVRGAEGSQNATQGGSVSVNGMRDQSNNFLLDGIDNNDHGINQVVVPPPIDSIREFKVQSGLYPAEFGTRAGAQLNFVTRSGGNDFHGSVYEFHRNAALDAKNFFDFPNQNIPKFIRNQYGISLGGPIVRDRTFVFANFEGLRERKAITRLARVPSAEFIRGDFRASPGPIRNPRTGLIYPDNIIPVADMDPIGRAIAAYYPAPNTNQAGGNLLSQPVRRNAIDQFVTRIDHQWGSGHSFFGRYAFSNEDRFNPFDPLVDPTNVPGFGSFTRNKGQNLAVGWIYARSSTLLNDLRIGYIRKNAGIVHENQGNDISKQLGITGLPEGRDAGFPGTQVAGFDSLMEPLNLPQDRAVNTYEIIESLSWQKGRHLWKFGGNVQHHRNNGFLDLFGRGQFVYAGISGHPVADLLLGTPVVAIRSFGEGGTNWRWWSTSLYVQDNFRISNRFNLEYGLRYEYYQTPFDQFDRLNIPDLDSDTARYIQCGTEDIPRGCMNDDKNNFAPRVGFAFTPWANRGTVVRGGYGVFYDAGIQNYNGASRLNPPNFGLNLYPAPSLQNPFPAVGGLPLPLAFLPSTKFRQAYAQQWSLNVQQEFVQDYLVEVAYIGTKGSNLQVGNNPNQPRPGGPPPHPAYSTVDGYEPEGSSIYHGLSVRTEKRFNSGYSFSGSYTFSKSIDDSSALFGAKLGGFRGPQNSLDRGADRGLSDFDHRHNFVMNAIWELPFGSAHQMLEGWQVVGILNLLSGSPFTPLLIGTSDSQTDNGSGNQGAGVDRPNLIGNPNLSDPTPERWFNTRAFARPVGTFGSAGRNILTGPGFHNVDLALMKTWSFGETSRLQFRTEVFNLFNHPNFNLPVGDFNSQSFGSVTSAKDSRQIQFGMRIEF